MHSSHQAEDAVEIVRAVANTDVNIIFGAVINEALTDEIVVTVIATGFDKERQYACHAGSFFSFRSGSGRQSGEHRVSGFP